MTAKSMEFAGSCPFLTCVEPGPHSHGICATCGAVQWGNIYCAECREHQPVSYQRFLAKIPLDPTIKPMSADDMAPILDRLGSKR